MANTYTLISSNVLSSSAASVTFSSIPATYTDLVIRYSTRASVAGTTRSYRITMNGSATGYSWTFLNGNGSAADSGRGTSLAFNLALYQNGDTTTANTFTNGELYFANYAGSAFKVMSSDTANENNSTTAFRNVVANLWQDTSAITSITIANPTDDIMAGSSFYLYGIKNS